MKRRFKRTSGTWYPRKDKFPKRVVRGDIVEVDDIAELGKFDPAAWEEITVLPKAKVEPTTATVPIEEKKEEADTKPVSKKTASKKTALPKRTRKTTAGKTISQKKENRIRRMRGNKSTEKKESELTRVPTVDGTEKYANEATGQIFIKDKETGEMQEVKQTNVKGPKYSKVKAGPDVYDVVNLATGELLNDKPLSLEKANELMKGKIGEGDAEDEK